MIKLKCIDCQHHADFDMKCNLGNANYKNQFTTDLSKCFTKSNLHNALDQAIQGTDNLIKKLPRLPNQ